MRAVARAGGIEARLSYQEHVIKQTAMWRPHNSSSPGQDMCTLFFQFFQDARANDTDFEDRILVSSKIMVCTDVLNAQMQRSIKIAREVFKAAGPDVHLAFHVPCHVGGSGRNSGAVMEA